MEPHLRQGIPLMAADTPSATYTGSGLSIAIVDTGIDTSHPRLGGGSSIFNSKVIGGYDTGDNDADPRPNIITGEAHGTACAGIAAGDLGDSGDYIGGVAPGAKLYALKITSGDSGSASDSALIAAWEWAISHKNDDPANPILIISTSFGGGIYFSACDIFKPGLATAAANAVAAGITIFVSSGNDGFCSSISSPACISYVNSVGAVYDANIGNVGFCVSALSCATDKRTGYVCDYYGQYASFEFTAADKVTVYSNSASFLTLLAPAHNAYTTDIRGVGGYASGDFDPEFGGTSAACPYAAGAAAVLQSAAKAKTGSYLTPAQVRSYLTSYGTTITDGKVTSVQKPRIDLASAVNALPSTLPTVNVTATDATAIEAGLNPGIFTFNRSGSITAPLTVNYSVTGTATPGSDYQSLGTSVTFAAGSASATQTVTPVQDFLVESDETVILTLATGTGYAVGSPNSATVTLTSDDVASYLVTAVADAGGSISPPSRTVAHGETTTFSVTTDTGYSATVSGCGGSLFGNTYTTGAITAACTVTATFTLNSYTVTASAGTGGSISPPSRTANHGATTTFTVTPNTGYSINTVSGCGGSLSGTTYTTGVITSACTVSATFNLVPPFNDVPASSWAYDYILAVRGFGITTGCGNNNYCPTNLVTRDQMAAFLIRAIEGDPQSNLCAAGSPYSDVPANAWYCSHVKRLVDRAITGGCGNGNYCPMNLVTREQMAAFIVRSVAGEPPQNYCGGVAPFNDVSASAWSCGYIKKLVELGITQGCGNGNYCPTANVNREQMAAFLARAFLGMK